MSKDVWDTQFELIATLEKEICGMEEAFGMIKASHPDGTYSLVVLPEDEAELSKEGPIQ